MKRVVGAAVIAYLVWAWVIAPVIVVPLSVLVFGELLPEVARRWPW